MTDQPHNLALAHELRPMPILLDHFPSAPCIDFGDSERRVCIRCKCGQRFYNREASRVMEDWARHANDAAQTLPPALRTDRQAVELGAGGWHKNAAGVKDGASCYRTIGGVRWSWWAEDADRFKAAGVRHRRAPDGQGTFIHPEDEEKASAALFPAPDAFARTTSTSALAEGNARLREALGAVIGAWETLPGPRRYSAAEVQAWIVGPLTTAINRARALLHREGTEQ